MTNFLLIYNNTLILLFFRTYVLFCRHLDHNTLESCCQYFFEHMFFFDEFKVTVYLFPIRKPSGPGFFWVCEILRNLKEF